MKFKYVGEAPDGFIEQYGARFVPGQATDVTEEWAIAKLLGNRFFVVADEGEAPPKRRGRPPKIKPETDDGDVQ